MRLGIPPLPLVPAIPVVSMARGVAVLEVVSTSKQLKLRVEIEVSERSKGGKGGREGGGGRGGGRGGEGGGEGWITIVEVACTHIYTCMYILKMALHCPYPLPTTNCERDRAAPITSATLPTHLD